ncbi:MAG: type II secretion system protein [Sedimentisphaerales bacterium]
MMNYKSRFIRYKTRGFTLIELLVVIAIIALLLSILIPSLRKAKEKVRQTACKSNLRNVGIAILMYLDEHGRILPHTRSSNGFLWYESDGVTYRKPGSGGTYWGIYYKDYLKDTKIFGCPSLRRVPRLIYNVPDPSKAIQHAAFGLNHHPRARQRNVETIRPHSEFIICTDHAEPRTEGSNDVFHNHDTPGAMNLTKYRLSQGGSRWFSYRQIWRHNIRFSEPEKTGGRANILWLDGHVSHLEETTGDNVPKRWYTGDHKKK